MLEALKTPYDINLRSVVAFREMDKGRRAMGTFCGFMNMPPPMTKKTYHKCIDDIHTLYMKCAANSMKQAADELREVVLRDEFTDEAVADTVCRYICRWLVAKKRVFFIKWFCDNNLFVNREMFRFCSNVQAT